MLGPASDSETHKLVKKGGFLFSFLFHLPPSPQLLLSVGLTRAGPMRERDYGKRNWI